MRKTAKITIALLIFLGLTCLLMTGVAHSSAYPSGSDTMFHLYRSDLLYRSIGEGNWYPLIEPSWYNGVELMRYWAPLPVYVITFCQFLAGGDLFDGYLVFVGLSFFLGAVAWLAIGVSRNRIGFGAFLGVLWFLMPNNLYALFVEGNLPRTICMIVLPLFVHWMYGYTHEEKWSCLPKLIAASVFMVLCHVGYAGMILIAVVIYLLCDAVLTRKLRGKIPVLLGMAMGFLLPGVWVIPSLQGGITSTDSSQVMKTFFQPAWRSLSLLERSRSGFDFFYFGLAAFLVCVFGLLFAKKRSLPGFLGALLIFLGTTTTAYEVLRVLPGSQYLWMLRFISIALCFILFSLFLWDSLKKPLLFCCCVLLLCDTLPSWKLIYGDFAGTTPQERLETLSEETLIARAKEITVQRLALLDGSKLESMGAFAVSGYGGTTYATFGAGWQGASTASNIVQLNQAMEDGSYDYLFDRCLELGNDTVLVAVSCLKHRAKDVESLDEAAGRIGYRLEAANEGYRLYHRDVDGSFGVVSSYPAIGIGSSTPLFALSYPGLEETSSANLNDYSYEELSRYRLVLLYGFTYTDRRTAEELVLRLSEAGVRVVIVADGIPIDETTDLQEFLGVYCHTIVFRNGYPVLDTIRGRMDCDLFPNGSSEWKTVYLEGLTDCFGTLEVSEQRLEFYGSSKNENLMFVGLGLPYYYSLTKEAQVGGLLTDVMGLSPGELPVRTVVPMEIDWEADRITVTTGADHTNTTLAYHDNFSSESPLREGNHLTFVDSGTTVISLSYPYVLAGGAVSVLGVLLSVLVLVRTNMCLRREAAAGMRRDVSGRGARDEPQEERVRNRKTKEDKTRNRNTREDRKKEEAAQAEVAALQRMVTASLAVTVQAIAGEEEEEPFDGGEETARGDEGTTAEDSWLFL